MPIWEFECWECGHTADVVWIHRVDGANLIPVPSCPLHGQYTMKRNKFPRTGKPQFKGDGWASDGYSKKETT